jgi:hypothetical protein
MNLRYLDFDQSQNARAYRFDLITKGDATRGWRTTGKAARPNAPERISPKHAAILVTRAADQITDEQQRLLDRITVQCPEVDELRRMALSFRAALKADKSTQLQQWIEAVKRESVRIQFLNTRASSGSHYVFQTSSYRHTELILQH